MYFEHFGLDRAPFRITPNTGIFYGGAKRGAMLEALSFAILNDEGIVKVSGEVGSGKTLLCRMLLSELPDPVDTIYLANPTLDPADLLRLVANELQVPVIADNAGSLLLAIQQTLIERFSRGRRVVALVDEAHAMPAASLEQIRLLSNLETSDSKLIQIVLFGQPELDEILARQSMRQLKDRITHHFRLDPLSGGEIADYLDFRLRAAGYRGPMLFNGAAVRLLGKASEGLSRRLNILADKALLAAYTRGAHQVVVRHVEAAIRDCDYPVPRRSGAWIVAALLALIALGAYLNRDQLAGLLPDRFRPEAIGAALTGGPLADEPVPAAGAQASLAPKVDTPNQTPQGPATAPAPSPKPTPEPTPASPPGAGPVPGPAAPTAPTAPATTGPTSEPARRENLAPPAEPLPERAANEAETHPDELGSALGPRARALQAGTPEWVRRRPADTWFIQLHTVDGGRPEDIEKYLEDLAEKVDPAQTRIYVRDLGWGERVGIIYGEFAERRAAQEALRALPPRLRAEGAYQRQIRGLR